MTPIDELNERFARPDERPQLGLAIMRGRFVELSACGATATLTAAIGLVVEAQQEQMGLKRTPEVNAVLMRRIARARERWATRRSPPRKQQVAH